MKRTNFMATVGALLALPSAAVALSEKKSVLYEIECKRCKQIYTYDKERPDYQFQNRDKHGNQIIAAFYHCPNCIPAKKHHIYRVNGSYELMAKAEKAWYKGRMIKNIYGPCTEHLY